MTFPNPRRPSFLLVVLFFANHKTFPVLPRFNNLGHLNIVILVVSVVNLNTIQLIIAVDRVGQEVVNGTGEDILSNGNSALVTSGESLDILLWEILIIILIVVVAVERTAVQSSLALGLQLVLGLDALGGTGPATAVGEEVEEGDGAVGGLLQQLGQGLVLGQVTGLGIAGLAGVADEDAVELLSRVLLLGSPEVVGGIGETLGQILAGLPVDADGLGDQTGGAVLAVAVPEGLLEDRVGKPLVLGEVEADGDRARLAVVLQTDHTRVGVGGDLGAQDLDALEGLGEDLEVIAGDGGLELGGGVVKDDGPETGDLGNGVLAGGEDVLGHEELLGGDFGVDIAQAGLDELQLLDGGGIDDELVGLAHFGCVFVVVL